MTPESSAAFEFHEINEYVRNTLSLYITWFSFFLTTLFAGVAWTFRMALDKETGQIVAPAPFYTVISFFFIQLVVSIFVTGEIIVAVDSAGNRAGELLDKFIDKPIGYQAQSPIPPSFHIALTAMEAVLYLNLIFWVAVALRVFYVSRRKTRIAGTVA